MVWKKKNLSLLFLVELNFNLKSYTLNKIMRGNFSIIESKIKLINSLASKYGFTLNLFDLAEKSQTVKNISLFFYNINTLKVQNVINLDFSWNNFLSIFIFFVIFFLIFIVFLLLFFI